MSFERLQLQITRLERAEAAARERLERAQAEFAATEAAIATLSDAAGSERDIDARLLRLRIDDLRETWTRLQATRRMMEVYQQTVARESIPNETLFLGVLLIGTLTPLVIGALTGRQVVIALGVASAALGTLTLVLSIIARSRFDTAQAQARFELEITLHEAEVRYVQAALVAGIDATDVHTGIRLLGAELAALEARRAELHDLEDRLAHQRERRELAASELAAIEQERQNALDRQRVAGLDSIWIDNA